MSCDEDDTVNKPSCTKSLQILTSSISATIIQQAPGGTNLPLRGAVAVGLALLCLGDLGHFARGRQTALPKMVLMSSKIKQQCGMLRRAESSREMMSGANWSSLEFALEDLKEQDAATVHLESEESSWLDMQALPSVPFPQSSTHSSNPSSNPSSSIEHQGSGDYCSQVESPASASASYSTTSSSNQNGADDSSLSILHDGNVRAILKKVKVNEAVLNRAIETLGGGEKGLKSLMGYIIMWVKEQKGCKSSSSPAESSLDQSQQQNNGMPFDFASSITAAASAVTYGVATSGQRLTPAGPVIEPMLHQRNDRFHPFGGFAEMPMSTDSTLGGAQEMHQLHRFKSADSIGTPGGVQQELHHLHRFKSRRLMMGEDASEAIYHQPTTMFMGIGGSLPMITSMPGQQYPFPKPEMGGIPGPALSMGPMMPQMKSEDGGMQQQLYCNMQAGLGLAYACGTNGGGNLVDNSPAAATRAARRNRMARQRQSMSHHARTSSNAIATAAGSGCGGSSQAGLQEMGGTRKTGSSQFGARIAVGGSVNAERKGRNVESLTSLLQKELRNSDVGNLGRIVLPKKESEQHLPLLAMRGGINLQVEDFDSDIRWNFRYSVTLPPEVRSSPLIVSAASSFWPNNKSRMYLLENTGEFVKLHHLAEGDLLILYKDRQGKFIIRGKKQVCIDGTKMQVKDATPKSEKIFPEEGVMMPKVEGLITDRFYGGGAPQSISKELSKVGEADPFLKDIMNNMGTPFGSEGLLQPLERFPSLNLDFPLDEMLAATPKSPKSPKPEPAG